MITRRLGSLLRGKTTPFQICAACVLGALLGFAPPFGHAPGLYLLLGGVLLVANANIGLALLVAGGARIVSWLAIAVSFHVGRFLLDGPMSGIAHEIVNAPLFAWCGLDVYAVAGGQALGLVGGALLGVAVARGVGAFRRRMVAAAATPSRWREFGQRRWARVVMWLFFGGAGKQTWEEKLAKRVGNPIRVWGAVLVVVLVGGFFLMPRVLLETFARGWATRGLEEVNGATVDLGGLQLDLGEGLFGVTDLAIADPGALDTNLLQAARVEADIDQVDFLRRRVHMAQLVVSEARSGAPRAEPGVLVKRAVQTKVEETREATGDMTLEDVLREAEVWKQRLSQARTWIERLAPTRPEKGSESYAERVARRALEAGWLSVSAAHLVDEAPTFRLSSLLVEGLSVAALPGRVFDLEGSDLSTQPWLLDAPAKLSLVSRDGAIRFAIDLAPASKRGGAGALQMSWKGLSVDVVLAQLHLPGGAPLSGGTLDLELDGGWPDGRIGFLDLPLRVTLRGTTLKVAGLEPTLLETLVLPIGISGPLDAPRVKFDGSAFADALKAAGKDELAQRVRAKLEDGALEALGERAGVELPAGLGDKVKDGAQGALEGLLGGKKKKDGDQ